jgi:spore maturation protein CgeB
MKLVVFGLTVTSSWGNGHATIWRGLLNGLAALGHETTFFERDLAYYAAHRDLTDSPHFRIQLYRDWHDVADEARSEVDEADAAIVTSYCKDAIAATDLILSSDAQTRIFYDLDTPVTLQELERHGSVDYMPRDGLSMFDLVLSYTGGHALEKLRALLGAREVAPLYGSVDPLLHSRSHAVQHFRADLSYLGTYAQDRQSALEELLLKPARAVPERRFLIGGAQYPPEFPWSSNIYFVRHVPPPDHAAFYSSALLTLNITRAAMSRMGYCPSGRLFEAAACATPVISDWWEGLDQFFEPDREILVARTAQDVVDAMSRPAEELACIGAAARARTLRDHTADKRARELIGLICAHKRGGAGTPRTARREGVTGGM